MTILIQPIEEADLSTITTYVTEHWGETALVVHGEVFHMQDLDGVKAVLNDSIVGFLHYQVRDEECEILTLASLHDGIGVGSALLDSVEHIARNNHCRILSLITTNDNLHALGFYQRRGFYFAELFPGQVDLSRKIKPSIPEMGMNNIPIRDELRLVKTID